MPRHTRIDALEADSLTAMRSWPFLVVRREGEGFRTIGQPSALLGAPVPRGGVEQGVWVRWHWDGCRLDVRQDRFGFHPFFYFVAEDAWGIGASLHVLLEHGAPRDLDDDAIALFLRLGYYLRDRTPFRSIRALPPGGRLVAEGLNLSVRVDVDPRARPVRGVAVSAASKLYGEMFQSVIDRMVERLPERTAVPLSGGRDSRHIVMAMHRAGFRPSGCPSVALGPPRGSEDPEVAQAIANRLGLPFERLPAIRSLPRAEVAKNVLTNLTAEPHGWIMPLRSWLERHGTAARFDGIAGDVLSQFSGKNPHRRAWLAEGRFEELASDVLKGEGYLPGLLTPEYRRRWSRESAVRLLADEFSRHADQPAPYHSWMFWNRTRRGIASWWTQLGGAWDTYAPFLDHELYDFLGGLPTEEFYASQLHHQTLVRTYPEHADLPFADKPAVELTSRPYWARQAGEVIGLLPGGGSAPMLDRRYLVTRLGNAMGDWHRQLATDQMIRRSLYLLQLARAAQL